VLFSFKVDLLGLDELGLDHLGLDQLLHLPKWPLKVPEE